MALRQLRGGVKLGDDRKDDPLLTMTDALRQVTPGADFCFLAFFLCGNSRAEGAAGKEGL
jgi:hypothetical protein